MRWILAGSLVLMGCSSVELTNEGMAVHSAAQAPPGCQILGTIKDSEGGGLRSFAYNRSIVEARLRNEAARIGGNTINVVQEEHGDTDEGLEHFRTGVAGVATPNPRCTNCVLMTATVLQCGAAPAPAAGPPSGEACEPPAALPPRSAPPAPPPEEED